MNQFDNLNEDWTKELLWNFFKVVAGIILLISFLAQIGCASSLNELHSKDITQGCEMVEANARLGYFNQEGNGSACKMICSPELPKGYKYSFDNGRCKASVGVK